MKNTLCPHQSCYECMNQYLFTEITESRVNIACPECPEPLHPNDIRDILENDTKLYNKYEEFMLRRVLTSDPDARWCPAPNCKSVAQYITIIFIIALIIINGADKDIYNHVNNNGIKFYIQYNHEFYKTFY